MLNGYRKSLLSKHAMALITDMPGVFASLRKSNKISIKISMFNISRAPGIVPKIGKVISIGIKVLAISQSKDRLSSFHVLSIPTVHEAMILRL